MTDLQSPSLDERARCMVIGSPIHHSLSPLIHRLGYEFLGLSSRYLFIAEEVKVEDLPTWLEQARERSVRGVSCTMPHKEAVIPLLDDLDPVAREVGAVNTIVNEGGRLIGYNTDWGGALRALERALLRRDQRTGQRERGETQRLSKSRLNSSYLSPLSGKRVAILGAGGASRALIYAMCHAGAEVKVFNRDLRRAQDLAQRFSVEWGGLEALSELRDFEVIIQATSVGMGAQANESLIDEAWFHSGQVYLETIYAPHETLAVRRARSRGAEVVLGIEMLLEQAYLQFHHYTGFSPPRLMIEREIERHLQLSLSSGWPEPLVCGVVTGSTLPSFLENLARAQALHPLVELRVDSLKELMGSSHEELTEAQAHETLSFIKAELTKPAILTYRRATARSAPSLSAPPIAQAKPTERWLIERQRRVLQAGLDLGIGLIDVDLTEYDALTLRMGEARLILSTHDYQETPSTQQLHSLLEEMAHIQPFAYKIASYASTRQDLSRLFQLLTSPSRPPRLIVIPMGERFAMSRALAPLFGSYLTFAALDQGQGSAPGQRTLEDYHQVYDALQR